MSNWRVFLESQDLEPKLELSLLQLPDQPLQPPQLPHSCPHDEARPSKRRRWPRFDQLWHKNLQEDSLAMMILLHKSSIEPGGHDIIFQGHFQGPNADQYRGTTSPSKGHYNYLNGLLYLLIRNQQAAYIVTMIQQILKFLEIS